MITAYYDLKTSPPTFDFVAFLMAAERERLRRKDDTIAISILPGPVNGFRRDNYWPFTTEDRVKTLHHIVLPMARMLPSVAEVTVRQDRPIQPEPWSIGLNSRLYGTRLFVECMREGIRPLRPSDDAQPDSSLVTITLREAEHWPERNSNVPEWQAAAREIEKRGYRVEIIRDAGLDLDERARLYSSSVCNLGVSNGPMWFAMALDAPVLMLKPTVEGLMRTCSTAFFRECGISPGGQIAGAPAYQRIAWQDDKADTIVAAFDEFILATSGQRSAA